jgi:hypothetical protein
MIPPTNAMSAPARIGTCRSATALARMNRGSTWITLAPRFLASITHWKTHRVALGHVGTFDEDAVRVLRVLRATVVPSACPSPANGDGQRPNPGRTRLLQGIEADNHRSQASKYLSTTRYFSCQRDRYRSVSHLILKLYVELKSEKTT